MEVVEDGDGDIDNKDNIDVEAEEPEEEDTEKEEVPLADSIFACVGVGTTELGGNGDCDA